MTMALVHAEGGTLLVRASGDITYPDVERVLGEMDRALVAQEAVSLLADCRGVRSTISAAELRKASKQLQPFIERGVRRFALVTDSTFMYGIGRMFGALVELTGASLNMFQDMESAQRWLDEERPQD